MPNILRRMQDQSSSDAKAWKHLNVAHPDFASNIFNVYLGLWTDGFGSFGMYGREYSLWPVTFTLYNFPPEICVEMKLFFHEYIDNWSQASEDVTWCFLQPLIKELKELWSTWVHTYDCSLRRNFTMQAIFPWTINDFHAYRILSGWATFGRLACPYCWLSSEIFSH